MRRKSNTVNHQHSALYAMYRLSDSLDIINRSQNIRRMCASHQSRLRRQKLLEIFEIHPWRIARSTSPPFHLQPETFSNKLPWIYVGFMVEFGEDEFVAGSPINSTSQVPEQLCRGWSNH